MTDNDWARLGREIIRARAQAGIDTAKALADEMGVSARIIGEIENGRRTSYSATTIAKLETALGWGSGSVDSILRGGDPSEPKPGVNIYSPAKQKAVDDIRARPRPEVPISETTAILNALSQAEIARIAIAKEQRERALAAITRTQGLLTDVLSARFAAEDFEFRTMHDEHDRDDFDLVADDAGGHDHETEDEDRETEP